MFSEASQTFQRVKIIQEFLIKKLKKESVCTITQRSLNTINENLTFKNIPDLARDSYASERSLRRKFVQHLGLPPKKYIAILRFRNMIKDITSSDSRIDWWNVIAEHGYYDFSHLSKDFKKFTHMTPDQYMLQYQIDSSLLPKL